MPYYVYVIELDKEKFVPNAKFRKQNPRIWNRSNTEIADNVRFLYVGQSCHEPDCRFQIHKQCHGKNINYQCKCSCGPMVVTKNQSNNFVRQHGKWLRRKMYEKFNPIETRNEAVEMEDKLADILRNKGLAVYSK